MSICVEIEIEDDGTVSVGVCPPEAEGPGEEQKDKSYLQPAGSVDEALAKAKQLLAAPMQPGQQEQQQGGFNAVFNQGTPPEQGA